LIIFFAFFAPLREISLAQRRKERKECRENNKAHERKRHNSIPADEIHLGLIIFFAFFAPLREISLAQRRKERKECRRREQAYDGK